MEGLAELNTSLLAAESLDSREERIAAMAEAIAGHLDKNRMSLNLQMERRFSDPTRPQEER